MDSGASTHLLILLQQIQLSDDETVKYFEGGELERVTVHRRSRKWRLMIRLPQPLPYVVFEKLYTRTKEAFQTIAQIELILQTPIQSYEIEELVPYWPFITQQLTEISPPILSCLQNQQPIIQGNRLLILCQSEMEKNALQSTHAQKVVQAYEEVGFSSVQLAVELQTNEEESAAERAAFYQARELEEQAMAQKAFEEMVRREQLKKEQPEELDGPFVLGNPIQKDDTFVEIRSILEEEYSVIIEGYVFATEVREFNSGRSLLTLKVTDYTDSIIVKMFSKRDSDLALLKKAKKGMWVRARGRIQNDDFVRDLTMMAKDLMEVAPIVRQDTAPENEKRIELHTHTMMSQMDAVVSASALVEQAAKWGHQAIAITDHANVQAFPEAYAASKKHDIQVIFGMEANLVDDGVPVAYEADETDLASATYVVFDVETTGLSSVYDTIIELAAVKIQDGKELDRFERFADPHHPLSAKTIELTGITDAMVQGAPEVATVVTEFIEWIGDAVLVAHNAAFDMGFLYEACKKAEVKAPTYRVIDTVELARLLHPDSRNHRLDTMAKKYNVELTNHHRAIYDAEATGFIFLKMLDEVLEMEKTTLIQLNDSVGTGDAYKRSRPNHCTILATNDEGIKNLFKLVSYSHMHYFYRVPRIPRSLLQKYRKGLLVGSACADGEVFNTVMQKPMEEAEQIARFYDYLEIQPKTVYEHLIERDIMHDEWHLEDVLRKITKLGKKLDLPVCATGNVHYLDPTDAQFREILIRSQGGMNPLNRQTLPQVHFRTTQEMLEEFSFLGEAMAKEVVIENPLRVIEQIGEVKPIKDDLYTPKIEGAEEEVRELTYTRAHAIYGESLPEVVAARIEKELKSIIGHGFAVIYLISHKLVKKSLDDGYLVGSRGSVGSSLVATMMEITEVNPLAPHYVCPSCKESIFYDDGTVSSGYDLPDKECPSCKVAYKKDGQDIPFETFLGFEGDKVPDIDLNFSGDYQPVAHNYTKELFGEDYVYRAGTIGTVAERTAYGYVRGYMNDNNLHLRGAEIDRLVAGCSGVKRSTGQHPGGIIVVPNTKEIFDFTPIQFPANDLESAWRTTHFDFHSIENNLLKLDILGHDDPTMIKMLEDLSGIDPQTIPPDDVEVMKLFSGTESLGIEPKQINCKTGTLGVPEFGTRFVRQMLEATKPSTFSELIQISGLSHGTDVWLGNAQELIKNKVCELSDVIGCRDDIMVYLIYQGLNPSMAFKIMEFVRKGRGLTPEFEAEMRKNEVPEWYIDSCKKIKYMFPKAHAAAYVLMALRIAYFKVHYPIMYYAAYFTVRASDFDLKTMTAGSTAIRSQIEAIDAKGHDAAPKEKTLLTVLEIALEMHERGFTMAKPDLYKSAASEFLIEGDTLIPPFDAIPALGTSVAKTVVEARKDGEFLSKEDFQRRGRVSKTVVEYLDELGCLEGMPDANQLSLF